MSVINSLLNKIKPSGIMDIINIGSIFKDELDTQYMYKKNLNLSKMINKSLSMPSLSKYDRMKVKNDDYLRHIKNFIRMYNENNKHKMAYIKKSIGFKYILGDEVLKISTFFGEFEDFENAKAQNIFFITLDNRKKPIGFRDTIVFTRIIGQWALSDVILGKDKGEMDIQFYDLFKDDDVRFLLDENIIKDILANKEYISNYYYQRGFPKREFKTFDPEVVQSRKDIKIQIGDKCMIAENNNLSFGRCSNATKFNMENGQIKYKDNCVSYHENGEVDLIDCDAPTECSISGGNCNKFQIRRFGGIEVVGTDKCLNSTKYLSDCYDVEKAYLLNNK